MANTKYYVEVGEEMYGTIASSKHYGPENEKDLKRLWKHLCKVSAPWADITAYEETDEGLIDLSFVWYCVENAHTQGRI